MKALFVAAACCAGFGAAAQELSWYSIDTLHYYQLSHCVPGSVASFYSSPQGGRLLGTATVGSNGSAVFITKQSKPVRLALNTGPTGTGRAAFPVAAEFAFAAPAISTDAGKSTLTWKAGTDPLAGISFQVLRSTDGGPYRAVATIPATGGAQRPQTYTWQDAAAFLTADYKIQVVSSRRGERHTTTPLQADNQAVALVPTLVTSECRISAPAGTGEYAVIAPDGRRLFTGRLAGETTTLRLGALPAGNYSVQIRSGGGLRQVKITKL